MSVPNIPANYLCPITVQIMFDPVIAEDGCTYEREEIERWFNEGHNISPMGHGIIGNRLIPNRDKRAEIMQFLDGHAEFIHDAIETSTPEHDNLEFINALIKRNSSNLNRRQENTGNTPLHIAVMHNKINLTQFLLQAGANCKVRNNQHQTPKKVAKELEFWEIVELIDNYHPRSNQMTSGTDDLRRNVDMLQQENRQLDAEITRLTAQMQRLNVNQPHREQPNFLRFFSRQAMELLALGTMVAGVAAAVKYQRSTTRKLNEQQLAIDTFDNALKQMLTWKDTLDSRLTCVDSSLQNANLCLPHKFANNVAYGKQEEAEIMLRENPDLALIKIDIKDCAGRKFKQITAFQYAFWALDWHMWKMVVRYLPKEEVRKQLESLDNGEWVAEHGVQVSWQNLIDALQSFIANYDGWKESSVEHWITEVGAAQVLLPAHVINEYRHPDRSFEPCPKFDELILPRSDIVGWIFNGDYILGKNCAWLRSWSPKVPVYYGECPTNMKECVIHDYKAIRTLFEIRTAQREKLIYSVIKESKLNLKV